jgi:hypothetical protein
MYNNYYENTFLEGYYDALLFLEKIDWEKGGSNVDSIEMMFNNDIKNGSPTNDGREFAKKAIKNNPKRFGKYAKFYGLETPPESDSNTTNENNKNENKKYLPAVRSNTLPATPSAEDNDVNNKNKHIGGKVAAGTAAVAAAAVASKAIYDRNQYKKWVAQDPKKRSKVSYKEWKARQKQAVNESFNDYEILSLNEEYYEAIYESFDDIDEYDLEEIKYYTEMYEETDRIYLEGYYDAINEQYFS